MIKATMENALQLEENSRAAVWENLETIYYLNRVAFLALDFLLDTCR